MSDLPLAHGSTTTWRIGPGVDLGVLFDKCRADDRLTAFACRANVSFRLGTPEQGMIVTLADGEVVSEPGDPAFSIESTLEEWAKFFARTPPPGYQHVFGMLMRSAPTRVTGSELAFAQHASIVRRVLELARRVSGAEAGTSAVSLPEGSGVASPISGHYVRIAPAGHVLDVYVERAGTGRPVLLLHTAGSDSRQYHGLMRDRELTAAHELIAFDLPGHGRSDRYPGVPLAGYSLTTELYRDTVVAVIEALGLDRPVVSGSSMAGEICLELAAHAAEKVGAVIACEAADVVPGRRTPWARHPLVDGTLFTPEWVYGLMSPTSPEPLREQVWWHYSQGGCGTFHGDIDFYSGGWDARETIAEIRTDACPVVMLTGEYDYSCTPAMSQATASRIPGAVFRTMPGLGHFPMAENPPLFRRYFSQALDEIEAAMTAAAR